MAARILVCIVALFSLYTNILAAPPLQASSSSTTDASLTAPVNPSLTLPLNVSGVNFGAPPLPLYPPDPLAYEVPKSPLILVFRKYLGQRRDPTWIQIVLASAFSECALHQPNEPLENRVYRWSHKQMDLFVKPALELGGPALTWGLWKSALDGLQEFFQKYESGGRGLRTNFQMLVKTNARSMDAQFTVGKGFLEKI